MKNTNSIVFNILHAALDVNITVGGSVLRQTACEPTMKKCKAGQPFRFDARLLLCQWQTNMTNTTMMLIPTNALPTFHSHTYDSLP